MRVLFPPPTTLVAASQKSNGERLSETLKEEDSDMMLCHMGILATLLRSEKVQVKLHQNAAKPLLTKQRSAHSVMFAAKGPFGFVSCRYTLILVASK